MPSAVAIANSERPEAASENQLIARIYEAAATASPWQAILTQLADHFRLMRAAVILDRHNAEDAGFMIEHISRGEGHELRHLTRWPRVDHFDPATERRPEVRNAEGEMALADAQHIGPRRSLPAHVIGLNLTLNGQLIRLRLYRARRSPRFDRADAESLARLTLHLEGAARISANILQLARNCELHEIVMNRVRIGLVVVADDDTIVSCNRTATEMATAGAGISLRRNQLHGYHASDTTLLKRMIASARREPGQCFAGNLSRPCSARDMSVFARSIPAVDKGSGAGPEVAVFLRDMTVREAMAPKVLNEMFGLTNAEGRFAAQFAIGLSVQEAAANLGIRLTTARGHLRSIFVKMGVTRQSELMRLLLV